MDLTPDAANPAPETFFGFRIGNLGLLADVGTRCEVVEQTQVSPIPNTQPWFSGLVNLRGNLVPVIDLRRWLGEETAELGKRRLFAIGKGDKTVALWIDGLPEVLSISATPTIPLPSLPVGLENHVHQVYPHQGQYWLYLRFDTLFKTLGQQVALR